MASHLNISDDNYDLNDIFTIFPGWGRRRFFLAKCKTSALQVVNFIEC